MVIPVSFLCFSGFLPTPSHMISLLPSERRAQLTSHLWQGPIACDAEFPGNVLPPSAMWQPVPSPLE